MITVTFAEPVTLEPAHTSQESPLRTDADGVSYRVACVLMDHVPASAWQAGAENPGDPPRADPSRAVIIAGVPGPDALALMGLA